MRAHKASHAKVTSSKKASCPPSHSLIPPAELNAPQPRLQAPHPSLSEPCSEGQGQLMAHAVHASPTAASTGPFP